MRKSLLLALTSATMLSLAACGGNAPSEEASSAEESELRSATRLDRVTPQEITRTYMERLNPQVASCLGAHDEEFAELTPDDVAAFTRVGKDSHWGVTYALRGIFARNGGESIPTFGLLDTIERYALDLLGESVDADGYFVWPEDGGLTDFYDDIIGTQEAKALSLAKDPRGMELAEVRAAWKRVESDRGNLDSGWLNPVKVDGHVRLSDIRELYGIRVSYEDWGYEAIEGFGSASEGPDDVASWQPIADTLKKRSIKKRWFFAGGDNGGRFGWSRHYLVVLDENDQLWGMWMGYSE